MSVKSNFLKAAPYQNDVLALPVKDIDAAASWYSEKFGMVEVERSMEPVPTVILRRDQTKIGFAINGGDASQDGAAIEVDNIQSLKEDLKSNGVDVSDSRRDERDGKTYQVFFAKAPDGLCYYFYEQISE